MQAGLDRGRLCRQRLRRAESGQIRLARLLLDRDSGDLFLSVHHHRHDLKGAATGFAGISIGLALTLIHLVTIPITNASVNPARSTGPALFAGGPYFSQLWLFWVASIIGAMIVGLLTRWMYEQEAIIDTTIVEERRVS
jgi:hypothetical protein